MTSTIDTSAIDVTKPATGNPTTQSMRDNTVAIKSALDTAKSEISALQAADTNDLPAYNCKAFVNFDGTLSGTITPRASGNIASVVKNSAGIYTITMTNALADANYVVTGSLSGAGSFVLWRVYDENAARTTTMFKIIAFNTAGTLVDLPQCNFAVFR